MSALIRKTGNLLDLAEAGEFQIVIQGCNCFNTMGSGLSKEIRERYPQTYEADTYYHEMVLGDMLDYYNSLEDKTELSYFLSQKLGNYSLAGGNFTIVNAYTQLTFNKKDELFIDRFEYESFAMILRKMELAFPKLRFGLPFIGLGLAGGDPERIIPMIERFADRIDSTGGSVTLVQFA